MSPDSVLLACGIKADGVYLEKWVVQGPRFGTADFTFKTQHLTWGQLDMLATALDTDLIDFSARNPESTVIPGTIYVRVRDATVRL